MKDHIFLFLKEDNSLISKTLFWIFCQLTNIDHIKVYFFSTIVLVNLGTKTIHMKENQCSSNEATEFSKKEMIKVNW